jgi:hypothetical protein
LYTRSEFERYKLALVIKRAGMARYIDEVTSGDAANSNLDSPSCSPSVFKGPLTTGDVMGQSILARVPAATLAAHSAADATTSSAWSPAVKPTSHSAPPEIRSEGQANGNLVFGAARIIGPKHTARGVNASPIHPFNPDRASFAAGRMTGESCGESAVGPHAESAFSARAMPSKSASH